MDNKIKEFIKNAISDLINNTSGNDKIKTLISKHILKIHFVPIKYRVFGGLLQSMNIKFGNFIEKLLHKIVEGEKKLKIHQYSSKKIILPITQDSSDLIDKYITNCQNNNFSESELLHEFNKLMNNCLEAEKTNNNKNVNNNKKHDIDALFSIENGKLFYLEIKYNDDHDTGKYEDINRKFIKSYIGICNLIKIYDVNKFKPILYYMTQKKMKGNIYLPEHQNIYRGDKLFNEFFSISYDDLGKTMKNIGDDVEIVKLFDSLYNKIRNKAI